MVGHFHYILASAVVFGLMAGFHYWMPKITGRMLHEGFAKWTFWMSFIGANLAFGPMHLLGLWGMPRRTFTYEAGLGWGWLNARDASGRCCSAWGWSWRPELLLEPPVRGAGRTEPMGRGHAGVGHHLAPAGLQLRPDARS